MTLAEIARAMEQARQDIIVLTYGIFGSVTFSMGRDCIAAVPCQGIGFRLAKGDLDRNRHLCFVC